MTSTTRTQNKYDHLLREHVRSTGDVIPAELEAARISARQSRMEVNRNMSCKTCEPLTSIAGWAKAADHGDDGEVT